MAVQKKRIRVLLILVMALVLISAVPSGRQKAYAAATHKWVKEDGNWRFIRSNGKYARGLVKIGNYYYIFDQNGNVVTGFRKRGTRVFYCLKSNKPGKRGRVVTGWHKMGSVWRYFSESEVPGQTGVMATGWQRIDSGIYYFFSNGAMAIGLTEINGNSYYFTKSNKPGKAGKLYSGFKTIRNVRYYFLQKGKLGSIGKMLRNTQATIDGTVYYFSASGAASTSPLELSPGASSNDDSSSSRTYTKEEIDNFINKLAPLAVEDMHTSKIYASVTIAQGILESGFGTLPLATRANNLFGMKTNLSGNNWPSVWNGSTYTKTTSEWSESKGYYTIKAEFRKYSSWKESVTDHSLYLVNAMIGTKHRYEGIQNAKNPKKQLEIIKKGGYATDPAYVSSVLRVIKTYGLRKYDSM